jgi:hypothetical protein
VSARLGTKKLSPFQLGLQHFNPPPKTSSYKGYNEILYQRRKSLGDEQCVHTLKDKGMQTQCEVKISLDYICAQKMNYLLSMAWIWLNLYPSNGTKGTIQNVSSIWKVKDHGSCDVTGKPDTIFNFECQTRCTQDVMVQHMYAHVV